MLGIGNIFDSIVLYIAYWYMLRKQKLWLAYLIKIIILFIYNITVLIFVYFSLLDSDTKSPKNIIKKATNV